MLSHSDTVSVIVKTIPLYALMLTVFYAVLAVVKIVKDGKCKRHIKEHNDQYSCKDNFPGNNNVNNDDSVVQDHQDVY